MVQIRFKVDKDGVVSDLEISRSGGSEFDREVIRVCKKMPRWKPAVQNGFNVPVNYMLPVTFIGAEQ
jgi:protein TonB